MLSDGSNDEANYKRCQFRRTLRKRTNFQSSHSTTRLKFNCRPGKLLSSFSGTNIVLQLGLNSLFITSKILKMAMSY